MLTAIIMLKEYKIGPTVMSGLRIEEIATEIENFHNAILRIVYNDKKVHNTDPDVTIKERKNINMQLSDEDVLYLEIEYLALSLCTLCFSLLVLG